MSGHDHMGREPVNAPIFPKPPVMLLLFVAGGFAVNRIAPISRSTDWPPRESVAIGSIIMVCAFGIAALAAREMARSRTTVLPGEAANSLVRTGVFRRTRNPIYLSFGFFMVGLGIATSNPWMVVFAPLLLIYLQERVIKREEAYLIQRFGPEYAAYKRATRRWL